MSVKTSESVNISRAHPLQSRGLVFVICISAVSRLYLGYLPAPAAVARLGLGDLGHVTHPELLVGVGAGGEGGDEEGGGAAELL